ncbi:MAG: hypothetical protein M3Y31_10700 [Gemmatimonadota bacterium]|nr:hypothetical protein [Gemmatimonadota bacterium]
MSGTELDPEELELLRAIALGECNFRPAAGESDMQWLRRVNRLRILQDAGLIRLREEVATSGERAGLTVLIGPCIVTDDGHRVLEGGA